MLIVETKLFIALDIGEIQMYDPFTLEKLAKVTTNRYAMPLTMTLLSTGTLLVGMSNGTLESFTFHHSTIKPSNPLANDIKVPYGGEIYSIVVSEN